MPEPATPGPLAGKAEWRTRLMAARRAAASVPAPPPAAVVSPAADVSVVVSPVAAGSPSAAVVSPAADVSAVVSPVAAGSPSAAVVRPAGAPPAAVLTRAPAERDLAEAPGLDRVLPPRGGMVAVFESTRLEPATPRLLHLLAARGFRLLTPAPGLARDRIAWRMVGPVTCALPVQAPNPPAASEGLAPDSASASDGAAAPDGVADSAGPDAPDGVAASAGPDAPDGAAASAGPDAPDLPAPRNSPAPHRVLTPNFDAAGPTAVAGPQVGPTALGECQLVLVPALAVDRSGTRLGRGGGWYDRALAHAAPEALVLGVCFPSELLPAGTLPHEPHDLPVHGALTSEGVVLF